jgi:hypothetical protein
MRTHSPCTLDIRLTGTQRYAAFNYAPSTHLRGKTTDRNGGDKAHCLRIRQHVQFLVDTNGELIPGGQLLSTSTPRMPSITVRNRTGNQPGMVYTM